MKVDLRMAYYGLTAFLIFLLGFFAVQALINDVADLVYLARVASAERDSRFSFFASDSSSDDRLLQWTKQRIGGDAAFAIVALPIWWFHWKRWRALAEHSSPNWFRFYLYALMAVSVVTVIVYGAGQLAKIFEIVLGTAPLSSASTVTLITRDITSTFIGVLIAISAWWYHRRFAESEI